MRPNVIALVTTLTVMSPAVVMSAVAQRNRQGGGGFLASPRQALPHVARRQIAPRGTGHSRETQRRYAAVPSASDHPGSDLNPGGVIAGEPPQIALPA